MKSSFLKFVLIVGVVLLGLNSASPSKASGPMQISGRWAGTAFANAAFDLSGDHIPGTTFVMTTYNDPFSTLEGTTDSNLISIGSCAPGALELQPFGKFTFRDHQGNSLYAEVPTNAPHLCFDPTNPAEVLQIVITGGTGTFVGKTGTGTLNIHDTVRIVTFMDDPPFGMVPAPTLVDSHGEFTLSIQ